MARYTADQEKVFEYLDDLRESGVTNMFGASPYIQKEFGYDKKVAGDFLVQWMESFGDRHPDD